MKKVRPDCAILPYPASRAASQISKKAMERSAKKRAEFIGQVGEFEAKHLVAVDESSCDKRTTYRGYGWSMRGSWVSKASCFVRGRRFVWIHSPVATAEPIDPKYSILPVLSLDGMLYVDIQEGSFNKHIASVLSYLICWTSWIHGRHRTL